MDLKTYGEKRGALPALARRIGISPTFLTQCKIGVRQTPADRCPEIEMETGGVISCEELRSDIRWFRIPDPAWPYHPMGRPLCDFTKIP